MTIVIIMKINLTDSFGWIATTTRRRRIPSSRGRVWMEEIEIKRHCLRWQIHSPSRPKWDCKIHRAVLANQFELHFISLSLSLSLSSPNCQLSNTKHLSLSLRTFIQKQKRSGAHSFRGQKIYLLTRRYPSGSERLVWFNLTITRYTSDTHKNKYIVYPSKAPIQSQCRFTFSVRILHLVCLSMSWVLSASLEIFFQNLWPKIFIFSPPIILLLRLPPFSSAKAPRISFMCVN